MLPPPTRPASSSCSSAGLTDTTANRCSARPFGPAKRMGVRSEQHDRPRRLLRCGIGSFQCGRKRIQFGGSHHGHAPHYRLRDQRGGRHSHPIDTATRHRGVLRSPASPTPGRSPDHAPNGESAYATDLVGDSVTPINSITNTAGTPITVSGASSLGAVAITPNGTTAYVANATDGTVVPLDTATNTTTKPITVGNNPVYVPSLPTGPRPTW